MLRLKYVGKTKCEKGELLMYKPGSVTEVITLREAAGIVGQSITELFNEKKIQETEEFNQGSYK